MAPGTGPGAGPGTGRGPVRVSNRSGGVARIRSGHVNRGGVARIGRSVAILPQESRDPSPFCDMGEPQPHLRQPLPYPRRNVPKTSSLDASLPLHELLFWGEDRTSPGHLPPTPPRAPSPDRRLARPAAANGCSTAYPLTENVSSPIHRSGERRVPCPTPSENGAAGGGGREGPGTCHCPRTPSTSQPPCVIMGKSPEEQGEFPGRGRGKRWGEQRRLGGRGREREGWDGMVGVLGSSVPGERPAR